MDASIVSEWNCDRGYRTVKQACVTVVVAKNAHLNSSGNDWECNRPHGKKQGKRSMP